MYHKYPMYIKIIKNLACSKGYVSVLQASTRSDEVILLYVCGTCEELRVKNKR